MSKKTPCPCGSERPYSDCCEPCLSGKRPARTAEALIRARYTAYTRSNIDFIYESSAQKVRDEFDREGTKSWADNAKWEGLEIVSVQDGQEKDTTGTVEFIAHYVINEQTCTHREVATFRKEEGKWLFEDGHVHGPPPKRRDAPKIGRNDPCPCGSGKKYKKCCEGK